MDNMLIFPVGCTQASQYAAKFLKDSGVSLIDHPSPEVTHLMLDVPSFQPDGSLRCGGQIEPALEMLPSGVTVIGGNLNHPALAAYHTLDLLQDAAYTAVNAAITADCALRVAGEKLPLVFADCPVLVIGWGRIGKCLGQKLKALGARVAIAARKESDRAIASVLGYITLDTAGLEGHLSGFRLIFNTAPELILTEAALSRCGNCFKIDLASKPGILGGDVIWAKGLPGIRAPESSGGLIAETVLRLTGRQ